VFCRRNANSFVSTNREFVGIVILGANGVCVWRHELNPFFSFKNSRLCFTKVLKYYRGAATHVERGENIRINIVIKDVKEEEDKWIEEASLEIGEWRAGLRSTYIRWSLAINGLEVAAIKYDSETWTPDHKFAVHSLVFGSTEPKPIAIWDNKTAAANHRETMPMLCAFGVIDMYSGLEEFLFTIYRIYHTQHTEHLAAGKDNRELRRLQREAAINPSKKKEWADAWEKRLDDWQRNAVYKGIQKNFLAFCQQAGLKVPSTYTRTTVETWSETLNGIALLRHSLVHGAKVVSNELDDFCKKPYKLTFDFKAGEPLVVRLDHLMGIQMFAEQWLSALNLSMIERAHKVNIKDIGK
jgi:hypothetical protein